MLWAITTYYNPLGYRTKLENYRRFRAGLNVPLVAVEAAEANRFELRDEDADILVQRTGGAVLWQKERLLNLALEFLPPECDAVAWLDCDVVFERDDWAEETERALRRHALVQLFSERRNLDADGGAGVVLRSYASKLVAGETEPEDLYDANAPVTRGVTVGLAWAGRRSVLGRYGLYDACILGTGDRAIASAALGQLDHGARAVAMNENQRRHYLAWGRDFAAGVEGGVGCVEGGVLHLWHGDLRRRQYRQRHEALAQYDFDPYSDITIAAGGCWAWGSEKPDLHRYVLEYFRSRREDGG